MEEPAPESVSETLQPPPEHRSLSTIVFGGPNGIRAGWRLLLFLSIAAVFLLILGSFLYRLGRLSHGGGLTPASAALGEGSISLALLLSAAVMARIEKRSLADYAMPARGALGRQFWQGVVWGFLAVSALLLVMNLAHGFSFGTIALHGPKLVYYACAWAAAFLTVSFTEEFLFRGYALFTLSTGIGFWPAAILLSALFGSIHLQNRGETWLGALSAALIGLFFCLTVRRTGGVWSAIGLHFMWDYSESFLYSVPDSGTMVRGHLLNSAFNGPDWLTGGPAGPEGSALIFVVIVAFFVLFNRFYGEARFPRTGPTTATRPPLTIQDCG